jgi:hypothetical protein
LSLGIVVATETYEGGVATVVEWYVRWAFWAPVPGYIKLFVKLTFLHELARPWAKGRANMKMPATEAMV